MFAWLWPRPTLDPWEKAWTENGMHWLCQQLGSQRLAEARVATPADFAGGSGPLGADDARAIFRQVCDFLRVDDSRFQLQIAADGPEGGGPRHDAPGSTCQLCLPAPQLADAQRLVATLARELAPEVLRQAGADLRPDEPDFQQRAELVPTYLGLGVFAANCGAAGGRGGWQWWSAERQGSLPPRVLEYALALFAWVRDELSPGWSRHLRLDAATALRDGLRYLRRTHDSLFQPATYHVHRDALSINQLLAELDAGTPSARIAALWDLSRRADATSAAVPHVQHGLRHRQPDVRGQAALTLASFAAASPSSMPLLIDRLHDESEIVRALAARALGRLGVAAEEVVEELAGALQDHCPTVVVDAAIALRGFGPAAETATPRLLDAFRRALVDCHDDTARQLARALRAVAQDAEGQVSGYFNEHEDDLREHAGVILSEQVPGQTPG